MTQPLAFINAYLEGTVTIANGAAESDAFDLGNHTLNGIMTPDGMTGTILAFMVSKDGDSYFPLRKEMTGYTYSINIDADGAMYPISPVTGGPFRFIKVVSNSAETGAKILTLCGMRLAEENRA